MRPRIHIIAIVAMMLFAVQGYAQRQESREVRQRTEQTSRSNRTSKRNSASYQRDYSKAGKQSVLPSGTTQTRVSTSQNRSSERQRVSTSPKRSSQRTRVSNTPTPERPREKVSANPQINSKGQRSSALRDKRYEQSRTPSSYHHHGGYRPTYNHHRSYHHHPHRCIFDNWNWYYWGGYNNRFIRHAYYHNRFFDSMLGYYLWGAFDRPTRIEIGDLSIIRRHSDLKISTGYETTYLDLHRYHRVVYRIGHTRVEITTTQGYANIYIYDEYGNTATYRL